MTKTEIINSIWEQKTSGQCRVAAEMTITHNDGTKSLQWGFIGSQYSARAGRGFGFVTRKRLACEFMGNNHAAGWLDSVNLHTDGITNIMVVPA